MNNRFRTELSSPILSVWMISVAVAFYSMIASPPAQAEVVKSAKNAAKVILVTGASSGSGRMIAETLAAKGYTVYAGARKQKDLEDLDAMENIHSLRLDVTVQTEIDSAVQEVRKRGLGLYAIVNNAGVGLMAPLIELPEDDLNFIFDVNVYGPYRISKAFAPLLIESKGRVVNIGSIAGFQTRTFYGPYSMSKHALEAFSDALAVEMERFDVSVSIIDPGGFSSNIGKNIFKRLDSKGLDFEDSLYKNDWQSNWVLAGGDLSGIQGPEGVVAKVEHALFSDHPQKRYMVVGDAGRAEATMRALLQRMAQLNHDQAFTYDREELIKLLDQELAKVSPKQ